MKYLAIFICGVLLMTGLAPLVIGFALFYVTWRGIRVIFTGR